MIINFNTGGSGGGVTEERVKELIAEYGAPILVEYEDIDTELGKEIYANPEKYTIVEDNKLYNFYYTGNDYVDFENLYYLNAALRPKQLEYKHFQIYSNGNKSGIASNASIYSEKIAEYEDIVSDWHLGQNIYNEYLYWVINYNNVACYYHCEDEDENRIFRSAIADDNFYEITLDEYGSASAATKDIGGGMVAVEYTDIDSELREKIISEPQKYVITNGEKTFLYGDGSAEYSYFYNYQIIPSSTPTGEETKRFEVIITTIFLSHDEKSIIEEGHAAFTPYQAVSMQEIQASSGLGISVYNTPTNYYIYSNDRNQGRAVYVGDGANYKSFKSSYAIKNGDMVRVYANEFRVTSAGTIGETYNTIDCYNKSWIDENAVNKTYEYSGLTSTTIKNIAQHPERYTIEDDGKIYQFTYKTSSGASYYYTDMMFAPEDGFIVLDKNEISLYYDSATSAYTKDLVENRQVVPLGSSGGGKKQLIIGSATTQDIVDFYDRVVELRQGGGVNQTHIFDEYDIRYFFQEGMNGDCQNTVITSIAFYRDEVILRGESSSVLEGGAEGVRQYLVKISISASGAATIKKDRYSYVLDVRVNSSNSAITFNNDFYGTYGSRLVRGNCPISVHGDTRWTTTESHFWESQIDNKTYLYCRFHNPVDDELWEAKWEFVNNATPIFMRKV